MANNTSSERSVENAEQMYAFGKLTKKYVFGVTNSVGDPKDNAKTNYDYLDQVNRLKKIRDENERSKDAEELARPKEIAKNALRAELQVKQREHVEVEARTMAIVDMQTALMKKIIEDTKESLREVYAKQMKEEIYAQYDKTAAAHKEEVKSELVKQLTAEMKASLKAQYAAQVKDEVTKQRNEELRSESIRLKATLRSEVESKLIEELSPGVKTMLRAELVEPVKEELRKEFRAEVYADHDKVAIDHEMETRARLMHELTSTVESTMRKQPLEEMEGEVHAKVTDSVYDGPTDRDLRYQNNDHYDDQYDNRRYRYRDDDHQDNEDHRYQNDDYDDYEERRYRQRDQHGRDHHHDDRSRSRSPMRLNRDEQPSYHPSRPHDEDLFLPGEPGDETDHVDETQEEAPPSSTFQGVKRSRFEQEYDEDDYWGRSPKRARISGYGGEEEETEEEGSGGFDTRGSSKEDAIDLDDSESGSEAIGPKVAPTNTRSGPFLEDSDDERYAETESFFSGMLAPHPASSGQDAQVNRSVGWDEDPDYDSDGEFDVGKTLVAGGEGVKSLEE